jgi:hypothetical protein
MMLNELNTFPKSLPNDLNDFVAYYPKKFPGIIDFYKKFVNEIHMKPGIFRKKCFELQNELFKGFNKIQKEFNNQKKKDLKFLVKTDQRLHKLFCYRFWIVNYLCCDGPLHRFYSDHLRQFSEKIAEWDDPEEKEIKVLAIERVLFQSDYVDLYLQNTFKGIEIYELLHKIPELKDKISELKDSLQDSKKSYKIIDEIILTIKKMSTKESKSFYEIMKKPLETAQIRGDNLLVYNMIMHAIEFYDHSLRLKERHEEMTEKLVQIFDLAKKKLSKKEFSEFNDIYRMARNFIEAKDIFGAIDPILLPFWFNDIHKRMKELLPNSQVSLGFHSAVFRDFVWYLPKELKEEVMTPEKGPFNLETL